MQEKISVGAGGDEERPTQRTRVSGPESGVMGLNGVFVNDLHFMEQLAMASLTLGINAVDFCEVFNPGRLSVMAAAVGMNPGTVFDLAAGWDLNDEKARDHAVKKIMDEKPEFLILSPKCTAFSTLVALSDRSGHNYQRVLAECMLHLGFVLRLIWVQIQVGRYFMFEHPWSAWSWYILMLLVRSCSSPE